MRLNAPKKFSVPGLETDGKNGRKLRPRVLSLAFVGGFIALIGLLAASFLRPEAPPVVEPQVPHPAEIGALAEIPDPAPLPDLNNRPPTKPLDVYLSGDPFPSPPPPPPPRSTVSQPRPTAAPQIPQPNPVALFANGNDVRYIGFVDGDRPVGTFAFAGKYLVMGPGDTFPGSNVRIVSLASNKAVLTNGRYRHVIARQ